MSMRRLLTLVLLIVGVASLRAQEDSIHNAHDSVVQLGSGRVLRWPPHVRRIPSRGVSSIDFTSSTNTLPVPKNNVSRLKISEVSVVTLGRIDTPSVPHPQFLSSYRPPYDSGYSYVKLKYGGYRLGRVVAQDTNWITFVDYTGLRQEIDTHFVTGIVDWKHYDDSLTAMREAQRNLPHPQFQEPDRFESYFAPIALAGAASPSGSSSSAGFSASLSGIFAFRIPGLLFDHLCEFISIGVESKSFWYHDDFFASDSHWSLQYLTVTPGLSYRGIISAGVAIGLPISADNNYYNNDGGFGNVRPFMTALVKVLIEPRLIVGVPIAFYSGSRMLSLLAQVGYPLSAPLKDNSLQSGSVAPSEARALYTIRLPEIMIGLSYVFSLTPPQGFVL